MTTLFQAAAVNSLRGGILILAVLFLRTVFRKTPRRVICLLWDLAALRLLLPFRLTAFFGLLPGGRTAASGFGEDTSVSAVSSAAAVIHKTSAHVSGLMPFLPWLWLAGTASMLIYALIRTICLHRKLSSAVQMDGSVWISDRISAPFTFGLLRPRIYLPAGLPEDCLPWVLAHEHAHIRHGDTRRKTIGFILLAVYWFSPILFIGWTVFSRDLELACDESVTAGLSMTERKKYARVLLRCSAPEGAFGTSGFFDKPVCARIRAVLRGKNQPRFLSILTGIACGLFCICLCFEAPASLQSRTASEVPGELTANEGVLSETFPSDDGAADGQVNVMTEAVDLSADQAHISASVKETSLILQDSIRLGTGSGTSENVACIVEGPEELLQSSALTIRLYDSTGEAIYRDCRSEP